MNNFFSVISVAFSCSIIFLPFVFDYFLPFVYLVRFLLAFTWFFFYLAFTWFFFYLAFTCVVLRPPFSILLSSHKPENDQKVACKKVYNQRYYADNKERILARQKRWRTDNVEILKNTT